MQRDRRAIVFDMDDTLYPYRQHKLSGFRAVAIHLCRRFGVDARSTYNRLLRATRDGERGHELQAALSRAGLPVAALAECLNVLATHEPDLRLPLGSALALSRLRRKGWRVGVLTNGPAPAQESKVRAMRLADHVDAVVYATTCGTGTGKPDAEPFAEIIRQLDVTSRDAVMVGDDERCDVDGALRAGLQAIRCCAFVAGEPRTRAGAVVNRLSQVGEAARLLLEEASTRHAA